VNIGSGFADIPILQLLLVGTEPVVPMLSHNLGCSKANYL
jgi:hypothetical protein